MESAWVFKIKHSSLLRHFLSTLKFLIRRQVSRRACPCSRNVYVCQLADEGGGECNQYNLYHTNHIWIRILHVAGFSGVSSLLRHFLSTLKFLIKSTGVKTCSSLKCFPITECSCSSTRWWRWLQVKQYNLYHTNHIWIRRLHFAGLSGVVFLP